MRVTRQKDRALFNLSMIVIITILFSLLSLSIDFIDTIRDYFPFYNTVPINDFFINIIFLWLIVTLGITYQRWRGAVSERRELEDIISSINTDVLVVVDKSGTIIMCNDSVKGVFDYNVDEALNQKIDLFYSKSDSCSSQRNEITEKLERDGFYIELTTGKKKNGEIFPLEVVTYHRKNRDGVVLLLRDITERKKTEEKLEEYGKQLESLVNKRTAEVLTRNKQLEKEINIRKKSNETLEKTRDYLDNIIESSLDPVVIVDTTGCITRVNESLLKMLGYTEEEVMGRHTTEFSPSVEGSYESTTGKKVEINQDLINQAKKMLAKLFEEGRVYNWERYFVRKDQKVVPVESNIVFLYDSERNMTGGVGILRDITERKKAEEESNEARNFLENIFETSADGIMVTDEQGCIVKVNRAIEQMLGYREDELVGKYTTELSPPNEERAKTRAIMFEQLFEKGYVKHWETEWFRKDGSLCPVEINITFLKDHEGNLYRAVAGIRDISYRKEAEESLRENEEQLRSLVQSASDAILTITPCGEIESWNSGAHAIFGYTPEEIIGMSFSCLVPERCRENNRQSMEKLLATGKGSLGGRTFSFPGMRKDGSEFPAEISYASYKAKKGMVLTGIVRDITERQRAEQEIREARNFLENIFKTVADGILVTDADGYITMANETTALLTGYSIDELLKKRSMDLMPHGESYTEQAEHYQRELKENGAITSAEFVWQSKDGSLVDVEMNVVLLKDSVGSINGSVGSIRDITERKMAEKELKENKEFLENIFKTTTDGILVTDSEGAISVVNDATARMLGYAKEEIIGEEAHIFKPEGDEHEVIANNYVERLFEEGTVTGFEFVWLKKDKSLIDVEVNAALLRDHDGTVTGAVSTIRDITERKEFEERLKKSEDKYRGLITHANDAIITVDREGIIIDYNETAEKIFGYSADEMLGKPGFLLLPVAEREKWQQSIKQFKDNPALSLPSKTTQKKVLRKDGKEIFVESSTFSLKTHGEYLFTSIVRDVTERKEMEYKLLQSEKLKSLGELAGGVAHDFNNVLAAILGRAQLLKLNFNVPTGKQEKRKSVYEIKNGLDIIEKAAMDGAETVRRIQEFARKRTDDKDFVQVNINELLDHALEFTRVKWKDETESKGIKIHIQKEFSPLPPTVGSASELREVFTNMINNAVDAMPQGGELGIKTVNGNKQIMIIMNDTGVGIPRDAQDRIFDPFFTTKGVQSTGLGMSVSYGIINRHRGTIKVDSSEGAGTTFTITLPFSEGSTKEVEQAAVQQEKQRKARILVIEDESEVRKLLTDILLSGGEHEVESASDGSQGIELFKRKSFDMVFTDLGMPGMSGWEVAEAVKSINKKVPVAIITGWNVDVQASEMKERGVDLIAYKPFEVNQVLELVQEGMKIQEKFRAA